AAVHGTLVGGTGTYELPGALPLLTGTDEHFRPTALAPGIDPVRQVLYLLGDPTAFSGPDGPEFPSIQISRRPTGPPHRPALPRTPHADSGSGAFEGPPDPLAPPISDLVTQQVIDRQRRPLKQTRLQVGGHPGPAREDRFHPQGGRLTRDRLREVVPLLVRDMHRFLNGMCGDPSLVGICGTGSGFLVATRTEVAVVIGTSRWPHPVFGGGPTAVDGVIRRTGPIGRVYVACTPVTGISSREPWIL